MFVGCTPEVRAGSVPCVHHEAVNPTSVITSNNCLTGSQLLRPITWPIGYDPGLARAHNHLVFSYHST